MRFGLARAAREDDEECNTGEDAITEPRHAVSPLLLRGALHDTNECQCGSFTSISRSPRGSECQDAMYHVRSGVAVIVRRADAAPFHYIAASKLSLSLLELHRCTTVSRCAAAVRGDAPSENHAFAHGVLDNSA